MTDFESRSDVVVVGLGAAGGLAAAQLAAAGAEVVGIEAGGAYDVNDFPPDSLRSDRREVLTSGKAMAECPTVRNSRDETAQKPIARGLMMNAIGGTKLHSGNVHIRLPEWQFRSRNATEERYGAGAIPSGSTLTDWPISYADLAPYYDSVEQHYGVSGVARDERGDRPEQRGNPFEGERTGPYPLPPLRRSGYTNLMDDAALELGWNPHPAPVTIRSQEYNGLSACTYCGHCLFNGCYVGAKGVPSQSGIPEAEASGRLRTVSGARVVEVLTDDSDGRATGVVYLKDGRRYVHRAAAVVLAAYTYENVRLMLLSNRGAHPDGLGNGSGQLGRHFTTHQFSFAFGTFRGRELNNWTGTTSQATVVQDFDADNFDHGDAGFIGGGLMLAMMEKKLSMFSRVPPPSAGRWGSGYKRWLAEDLRSMGHINYFFDEQPHEDNYLDLDPVHTDPQGFPVVRITRAPLENDRRAHAFLRERAEEWLRRAGADETWGLPYAPLDVSAHAFGGARMGDDPNLNVVDKWCFAHEVPNLAVLGGAVFPSATGQTPTPTIEALAWRNAEYLSKNWDAITAGA